MTRVVKIVSVLGLLGFPIAMLFLVYLMVKHLYIEQDRYVQGQRQNRRKLAQECRTYCRDLGASTYHYSEDPYICQCEGATE